MDTDFIRIWQIVHELCDQIAANQKLTNALVSQAGNAKEQAANLGGTGFCLRRYNVDISNEMFESELERTNAQIIVENQSLVNENKQLSLLLKEYENTMETIMGKFRTHSVAAQRHELTLTQHYENLLQSREAQTLSSDLASAPETRLALTRLTHHIRGLLCSMAGGEPEHIDALDGNTELDPEADVDLVQISELEKLLDELDNHMDGSYEDSEGKRLDWSVERESEISRLEKENQELRKMLGIDQESLQDKGIVVDLETMRKQTTAAGRVLTGPSSSRVSHPNGSASGAGGLDGLASPRKSYWEPPDFNITSGPGRGADFKKAYELTGNTSPSAFGPGPRRPGLFGAGRGAGLRGPGAGGQAAAALGGGGLGPSTTQTSTWNQPDSPGIKWSIQLGPEDTGAFNSRALP